MKTTFHTRVYEAIVALSLTACPSRAPSPRALSREAPHVVRDANAITVSLHAADAGLRPDPLAARSTSALAAGVTSSLEAPARPPVPPEIADDVVHFAARGRNSNT